MKTLCGTLRYALPILSVFAVQIVTPANAAPETRRGTLHITGNITFANPNRPTPTASASYEISDAAASPTSSVTLGHNRSVSLKRSGDTATITADIPYVATFDADHFSDVKMNVGLSLYQGYRTSQSTRVSVTMDVPADGTTTPLSFALRF